MLTFFPFALRGAVKRKDTRLSVDQAVRRIADMLNAEHATSVSTNANVVTFTAGMFRMVGSWNVLVQFSSGSISVEATQDSIIARYSLSTMQLFIGVGILASIMFLAGSNSSAISHPLLGTFLGFVFLWLFGMNYMIGMFRFPRWLKRGLSAIEK